MESQTNTPPAVDSGSDAGTERGWQLTSPAKINLGLKIFPRRADGYHDIDSWFVPISLADILALTPASGPTLTLSGAAAGITSEFESNLAGRAAMKISGAAGRPCHIHIHIHKLIPTGGGLGGGSSNAAAVLRGLNEFWQLRLTDHDLLSPALEIGSDVPFFIRGTSARCTGRGESMAPIRRMLPLFVVLMVPPAGISTADVYRTFDAMGPVAAAAEMDYAALANAPAAAISGGIFNDLEAPAFAIAPWLAELRTQAQTIAGRRVHMSGSGSTLFMLFDTAAEAEKGAGLLSTGLPEQIQILPVRVATG